MRVERIGDATLYLGDCMDILPTLPKVDAVITDPPYHGVKADAWDNQWKTDADFLAWSSSVCAAIHKISAFNASLYWFASPQMAGRLEVVIGDRFRVLNNIVWDKSGGRKGAAGSGIDVTALRGYWSANTERVIFAEMACGDSVASNAAGYEDKCIEAKGTVFGDYMRQEFKNAGVSNKEIAALFPSKTGGLTGCVSNWLLGLNVPTPEQYASIRSYLNAGGGEHMRRQYEDLRRQYEDLRREYEDLRRPFFVSPGDQWGDVWRFDIERGTQHPTQKPLALMRHIVKVSSRQSSIVLDPFLGSGTTGVAAIGLGRPFIGIEREPKYFDIACRRIEQAAKQGQLFEPAQQQPQQMEIAQ